VKDGRVVKGVNFRNLRDAGDPAKLAMDYRDQGADEIVFLDISATLEKRKTLSSLVKEVAKSLDIPFTVGGGIGGLEDARTVLCNGADKVAVNTAAILNPGLIGELADVFGSQCVVVAIDAKKDGHGGYAVRSHSANQASHLEAKTWAKEAVKRGAGEILVTSIDRDGTKKGYDLELLRRIGSAVNVPIIASGGCGSLDDFFQVFSETNCDAALAASLFHRGELTVGKVKDYLTSRGVQVRI
jgi:cyclase